MPVVRPACAGRKRYSQNDGLYRRVVPGVAWRFLEIPDHFPVIRLDRQDRGEEQIVAPFRTAKVRVPRPAVAGADIKNIGTGIVRHGVPNGTAAAHLSPLACPCLSGLSKFGMLERLGRA